MLHDRYKSWKALLLQLGLTLHLALSVAGAQPEPAYRAADCPRLLVLSEREGDTVVCGFLRVPESRTRPTDKTLELAVMTLRARGEARADPILFLQGGPGGAALSTLELWQNLPWRDERDIILIDQRGTGYSRPNLKCPEIYDSAEVLSGVSRCRRRLLRAGHDLRAYNSAEDAADIADLRRALELEALNLYGVSYGTRLALTVLRDHPEGVRSVVLDSAYPPQVNRLVEFGGNFERALSQVFYSCRKDERCNAAFPTLREDFLTAIADFNESPLELTALDGLEISGDELLGFYFQSMYSESVIPNLPYSVAKLLESDLNSAALLLSGVVSGEEVDSGRANFLAVIRAVRELLKWFWREVQSEGVYFSTECQEDVPFQSVASVESRSRTLQPVIGDFAVATSRDQFSACRAWRVPRADALETEAVTSDVPTLILAGSFDPITPPRWGRVAGRSLSRSHFFEVPNAAHGVFLSGECPVAMVSEFLNTPLRPPNASCLEGTKVEFYIPGD